MAIVTSEKRLDERPQEVWYQNNYVGFMCIPQHAVTAMWPSHALKTGFEVYECVTVSCNLRLFELLKGKGSDFENGNAPLFSAVSYLLERLQP